MPTVGALYADAGAALLVCAGLGVAAAVVIHVARGSERGRLASILLIAVALTLAVGTPLYVAAEQPSVICYDSIHNDNVAWPGQPPLANSSALPTSAPACSWVSFAPGGQWSLSSSTGPESTFAGSSTQAQFYPSSWGPSSGWIVALAGAGLLAIAAVSLALSSQSAPSAPGGGRSSTVTRSTFRNRLTGLRDVAVQRLRLCRSGLKRARSLGGLLALLGILLLGVSLFCAWYQVTQSGVVETFGPAGLGSTPWLGTTPPSNLGAAGMPYTGLLYDLTTAAIGIGVVAGAIGAAALIGGIFSSTLRIGRALLIASFLLAVAAPTGVAIAEPLATCGDFPLNAGGGNSSLAGDHCYWVTQNVSGGTGPVPAYGTGPGSGFVGGNTPGSSLTWGPSVGWYLALLSAAPLVAGATLAGWQKGGARSRRPRVPPTDE